MMPGEISCYNVFFTWARISGRWVGSDILLQHDDAPMGVNKSLKLVVGGTFHDWYGIEPVKVRTRLRKATLDTPGGQVIELSIGHEHPVLVQVWASAGANELSEAVDVQYLNLEVRDLPENAGGLLGSDTYVRPADSKCGLTTKETGSINSMRDLLLVDLKHHARHMNWTLSAHVRN